MTKNSNFFLLNNNGLFPFTLIGLSTTLLLISCGQNESRNSSPPRHTPDTTQRLTTLSKSTRDTQLISQKKAIHDSLVQMEGKTKGVSKTSIANAKIQFTNSTFDFGFIDEGENVTHDFEFVNTGRAPLSIKKVETSCGCTKVVYPFTSIPPNKSSKLSISYNSKGKIGKQLNTIVVHTNANNPTQTLTIKGVVR